MAEAQFRVHWHDDPQKDEPPAAKPHAPAVAMRLGDLLPLLADAYSERKSWIADFADDEITVSQDLYEVITAYQRFHHPVE